MPDVRFFKKNADTVFKENAVFDLIHKVIADWRVIVIFIIIAIYLEFVSFVAAYKKKNNVRKATIRKSAPVEQPPAAPPAKNAEEASEE